jgi:alpha-D-xyloside xylohydrolase
VFGAGGAVSYYLPAGTWTHVLSGEPVTGPGWQREQHGFLSIPLLARPGAVIPVGAVTGRPDYDYADGVTLCVYQLPDGARVRTAIPTAAGEDGAVFVTSRAGAVITVEATGAPRSWQVLLAGVRGAVSVDGGTAAPHEQGTLIRAGQDALTITLSGGE